MMKIQQHYSTSQQLVHELVHEKHVSVKQIAKACQLSQNTLYLLLSGTQATLRPQAFGKLFRFYVFLAH